MSYWSVLVPTGIAETNLVTNPSLAIDTTGYTALGASIARITSKQRRGTACLEVTPTSGTADGAYYGTVSLISGQSYTFSLDVLGVLGVPYRIYFATTAPAVKGTPATFTGTGDWQRVSVTWQSDGTASHRLYIVKNNSASTGVFYVDGVQCINAAYDVSYIDGDQQDCTWLAGAHASTSSRDAQSRAGGREINFDSYGVTVKQETGIGMPPARHLVQKQPLLPGGKFQGRKVLSRTIDLTLGVAGGGTFAGLHSLRKDLVDVFKPDLVKDDQPFILRYTGANSAKALEIAAVYDSGLEYNEPEWTYQEIQLRLIAYDDPFWREEGNVASQLTITQSLSDVNYVLCKVNGIWAKLGTGIGTGVPYYANCMAFGNDGSVFVGGYFVTAGGVTVNNIAKWDGSTWTALGATGTDNAVICMLVAPNGDLFIGGDFHAAGGVTVNHIAKWNGSTWSALGGTPGTNDRVLCLALDQFGILYAGGQFTTAGGVSADKIAKWSGSAWTALSAGSTSANVQALAVAPNNDLYIGGQFTTICGVAANRIARWNRTALSALGSGLGGTCYALIFDPNGVLYVGGAFTTAGGITANYVAKWNGSAWTTLGAGTNQAVWNFAFDEAGILWVCGAFTAAGGLALSDCIALWNGTSWSHIDIDLPGSAVINALIIKPDRVYLGFNTYGTVVTSLLNTVNNPGTHSVYPILHLKNSTATNLIFYWLKNETTDKFLWFNYSIQAGEELVLNFQTGRRSVISSYFGHIWRALLRNSDFSEFDLLPGNNQITAYGGSGLSAWMEYRVGHWAADGAAL